MLACWPSVDLYFSFLICCQIGHACVANFLRHDQGKECLTASLAVLMNKMKLAQYIQEISIMICYIEMNSSIHIVSFTEMKLSACSLFGQENIVLLLSVSLSESNLFCTSTQIRLTVLNGSETFENSTELLLKILQITKHCIV